jgi:hypothetical protein
LFACLKLENAMSQDDEEEGRFIAFLNARKQPGDNKPAFEGKLTLPEDADERRAVLWAHTTKAGRTMLAGRVGKTASEHRCARSRAGGAERAARG